MMYLDYPELESYKIETDTSNGVPFYRDTFFEEFISKQQLTKKLSDMDGAWTDYVEYLESFYYSNIEIRNQIEIFAQERDKWAVDIDFADEKYCFTLADLDMDGKVELIVSNVGGTGYFSYSRFYKIDDTGKLKELDTTFTEGDSQPDIMDMVADEMDVTAYFNIINGTGSTNFIVYDYMKASPDCYIYRVSSLTIIDDVVTETQLATQWDTYEGPDYTQTTSYKDYNGAELTKDEYDNYVTAYYEAQNATKHMAHFQWKNVSDIINASESETIQMLMESYEAYSFDE